MASDEQMKMMDAIMALHDAGTAASEALTGMATVYNTTVKVQLTPEQQQAARERAVALAELALKVLRGELADG